MVILEVLNNILYLSGDPSSLGQEAVEIVNRLNQEWEQLKQDHPELFEQGVVGPNGFPVPVQPPPPSEVPPASPQTPLLDNPQHLAPQASPDERAPKTGNPIADGVGPKYVQAPNQGSPLVLDLGAAGIELTSLDGPNAVYWDIDQDGMAEATGWVGPEDGLLALDRNGDGIVTDHTELFGTESIDGFVMLAELDSNNDGVINASDTAFENLIVWVDTNTDGYSQSTELYSLTDLGITSIDLNFSDVNYQIAGNDVRSESTFTMNGQTQTIVDAWFSYDNVNTVYAQDYTLDVRTLFLPTLRGYGGLPDLHIAMSLDNASGGLLEMVKDIAVTDLADLFDPAFDLEGKIRDVLFRWAGVEDVVAGSRGHYVDAQELGFLEALMAQPFLQGSPNPWNNAGRLLGEAFDDAYNAMSARILAQTAGAELFETSATYNPVLDVFEGAFTPDIDALDALISAQSGTTGAEVVPEIRTGC